MRSGVGRSGLWPTARRWARARVFVVPLVLYLCISVPHLWTGDWQRTDSGWYSAIAWQAYADGHWWTLAGEPGQPYFNKPPLAFWIHGLFLWAFGPSAFAARFPAVLAGAIGVVCTARVARRLAGRRAAIVAGGVLASTLEYFRFSHGFSLDLWQTAFMLAALDAATRRPPRHAASGAFVGLALMTKPLVALLAPVLVIAWMIAQRRGREAARHALVAIPIALTLAAPWHLSMLFIHGGDFVRPYFGAETVGRALALDKAAPVSGEPPWYYARLIAGTYWPWLAALLAAPYAWARGRIVPRARPLWVLAWLWALTWLAILTIFPDRRPRYAIVVYPAFAWIVAILLARHPIAWLRRFLVGWFPRRILAIAPPLAIVVSLLPIPFHGRVSRQWTDLFAWIRARNQPEIWQGGFYGFHGSRLFIEFGRWPITTRTRWGEIIHPPPADALLIYHVRDGLAPGPNEERVFESGEVFVTRLLSAPWAPIPVPDPGEPP